MGTRDPRVDAYIAKSPDFAKPILTHVRDIVHAACPDVEETVKWSAPFFDYNGIMIGMAAFKQHCAINFWKAPLIEGLAPNSNNGGESMGNLGRITSLKDLPSKKVLTGYVKKAASLNAEGVAVPKPKKAPKPMPKTPDDLTKALSKNAKARKTFEAFPPSHRREYIDWITEAKQQATRDRRLSQAVEWMAEGKARNWKHGA